ncbi:hypothetical protein EJ06DRAFT_576158 [Trichodelitschia bisporula]|uniref:DDHD domain-containing protein n=1 Tax=Trichodelitschia bisporula TaxID=703511 RepID=A0A6G1HZ66_9PEZI|nr:hypothetical protein EJ06DRAFT_576158 [Trichodelitschia bisporula]
MSNSRSARYAREMLEPTESPPPIAVRYFYSSPLAIDDPLSPLPPPLASSSIPYNHPPRPFSVYDNAALDRAWVDIRRKRLKLNEKGFEKEKRRSGIGGSTGQPATAGRSRNISVADHKRRSLASSLGTTSVPHSPRPQPKRLPSDEAPSPTKSSAEHEGILATSRVMDSTDQGFTVGSLSTTGNPFIRAPSRIDVGLADRTRSRSTSMRPGNQKIDSYNWGDDPLLAGESSQREESRAREPPTKLRGPSANVPVGVSRLHSVLVPELQSRMEPIYWSPVNDVAAVIRGTWFYAESLLPVEVEVANMLEAGYLELKVWSETWKDELNSAVEVGAAGEMKILHKLWPDKLRPSNRPGSSHGATGNQLTGYGSLDTGPAEPEKEREETAATAGDLIDIASGPEGPDNKASGVSRYGRDGTVRQYLHAGIIYANEREAYILRPNLQPSDYYGRRPFANYIRKGRAVGIRVVRGFDQAAWSKLHPVKRSSAEAKAREGVSTAQAGLAPEVRQQLDDTLSGSERPRVTDLVLVVHGIGQKLSERVESYHFTHAINAFRREVNVELGADDIKFNLRSDMGGIMVLPVNWRLTLSFEDGGYRDEPEDPAQNDYTLKDITPETLTSVRNIVSDVMLDIPYYLSGEHHPKMVAAVVREANRIYDQWCINNPGFAEYGRVHVIAHSLGSVMALDILSNQPTYTQPHVPDPSKSLDVLPVDHFIFNTKSLFICGSPTGFFLLLKRASLLPRHDTSKPGAENFQAPGVAGAQGTYGCIAVDNVYNVINPYDPVAYRLNATVDAVYAAALKPAFVPSSSTSFFTLSNPFRGGPGYNITDHKPSPVERLPSNVELETHNFTREEVAEKRAYLLNDNGQIDYFLRYGGGALEIQYLTMLGAHSSYWISRDFVRMIVREVGRGFGREGTLASMRAQKKKGIAR